MKSTKEVLIEARELISDPEHWTQGAFAEHQDYDDDEIYFDETEPNAPDACRWCASGAIAKIEDTDSPLWQDLEPLAAELGWRLADQDNPYLGSQPDDEWAQDRAIDVIARFNDNPNTTHADVLALFDRAIASLS